MPETRAVAAAVEALRKATVEGDGAVLRRLFTDEVSFGHSNGKIDRKADLLATLDGKVAFRSIVQSDQVIEVVGANAVVRHVFDGERLRPDGGVNVNHLTVLQVWVKQGGDWRLLARHASTLAA
ncbi:nuclear transport factor 2 family protein [Siculibacillus lacustris]|uniref:Nuclear transport factor 2 family protein n=1 Tax=Siculibacillus lacustris TaxID=1549641 RepID=A0A4Q9VVF4_9HYPH|nr:nuclear transport factor 2 family protein [Siculibacillus lacustris]TBW39018.1 nuclear transport factor 2 family protein [Siculibacillus lacustris]